MQIIVDGGPYSLTPFASVAVSAFSRGLSLMLMITVIILMGPLGGVVCHGAARSRKAAGFRDLWSSSSCAQVIDF